MSAKHILITGGAGFIGSHLAEGCLAKGYRVTIVDDLTTGNIKNVPEGADLIELDICDEKIYAKLPKDCTAVFHLAAQSSGEISNEKPYIDLKTNTLGTALLLQWARRFKNMRLIYSSSMAVYGNPARLPVRESDPKEPLSFYGVSKLASEYYIMRFSQFGIIPTIFRLFSIYGPGQDLSNRKQGIVSIYLSYLVNKEELLVKGSGERFRDLVYIDDVVDIWLKAMDEKRTFGRIYNLCTGKKTLVKTLVEAEIKAMGLDPKRYPVSYEGHTPADQFGVYGDNTALLRDIHHDSFIGLDEGVRRMVKWAKNTDTHG